MQSLVSIASKVVADNCAVEAVLDLPVELRDHLQPRYDRETQLKHFGSWSFIWGYNCVRYVVKVLYQEKYITILLYRNGIIKVVELNMYDAKLHGLSAVVFRCGTEVHYVYKLGKLISLKTFYSDKTPHYTRDFNKNNSEIITFGRDCRGKIQNYAYYSRADRTYVALIDSGKNVRTAAPGWSYQKLETYSWAIDLLKDCNIQLETPGWRTDLP